MDIRSRANALLSCYWAGKQVPVEPAAIAQARGVGVQPFPADELSASGWFRFEDGKPVIYFNSRDPINRQRFTIAHELGHYELGHGERPRDSVAAFNLYNFDPYEADANRFAAELLMPEAWVKWLVIDRGVTSLTNLASQFDVSEVAMRYRLGNLGLI